MELMVKNVKVNWEEQNLMALFHNKILQDQNYSIRVAFIQKLAQDKDFVSAKIMENFFLQILQGFNSHPDYSLRMNFILFMKFNSHTFKEELNIVLFNQLIQCTEDKISNVRILAFQTLHEIKSKNQNQDIQQLIKKHLKQTNYQDLMHN